MLEEIRRPELFDAVLDEVVRVRAEMGYPILVTPVSQLIAYQATRNVIDSERWLNVSDETVRYFLGHYGEFAAPPDPDVVDRVLSLPKVEHCAMRTREPGRRACPLRRPHLGGGAAAAADDAGRAGRRDACRAADRRQPLGRRSAPAPRSSVLLREVERRRSISYLRVRKGDDLVVWRRGA